MRCRNAGSRSENLQSVGAQYNWQKNQRRDEEKLFYTARYLLPETVVGTAVVVIFNNKYKEKMQENERRVENVGYGTN